MTVFILTVSTGWEISSGSRMAGIFETMIDAELAGSTMDQYGYSIQEVEVMNFYDWADAHSVLY